MDLRLLQLGDSALPIGGYGHSWGLEAAIDRGLVTDAASLEQWVRLWLRHALGPCEGVVVGATCRAATQRDWNLVAQANDLLWCSLTPPTLRHASRDMGEQLLCLAEFWPWATEGVAALRGERGAQSAERRAQGKKHDPCPERSALCAPRSTVRQWHHAPVFATLAAAAGSAPAEALTVYLHQAALGVLGAGVRTIPIGHSHGQLALARLHGEITALAVELASRGLETAGSFCAAYEVLCYAQSHLYTRLFRS
jgi:urease accessory protein